MKQFNQIVSVPNGQLISKQNFWAVTSPKKQTNHTQDIILLSKLLLFIFWEKLLLDNFVLRSTDL